MKILARLASTLGSTAAAGAVRRDGRPIEPQISRSRSFSHPDGCPDLLFRDAFTGLLPGAPIPHTEIAAKGHAIAEMFFAIESARALYYRAISEAQVDPPLEAVQRARAAHVTVQRAVVAVTQEAIRVCGGRAFLRRYPLERYARDRAASASMAPALG
jgi:hypothetical protein